MDMKRLIDEADKTAEDFVNIYYEKLDSKRNTMLKIYLDTAVLSWNGNKIEGKSYKPSQNLTGVLTIEASFQEEKRSNSF